MLPYCFAIAVLFVSSNAFAQQWRITERAPMPEPVTNNAVVEGWIGDTAFVYSFGGLDSSKQYSGIHLRSWRYNTVSDQWEAILPLPDTLGKIAAAASRVGDLIYIIGGYHVFANGSERSSDKVHRFDVKANQFLADGAPIPVPIDDHVQAVWRDSLIYVVTGWSNTGNVPNVQIYNPTEDNWIEGTSVPTGVQFESFGTSGTILGDTIFYYGGASFGFRFPVQNTLRKGVIDPANPLSIVWSVVTPEPTVSGYRTGPTVVSNQVFWLGGSGVTYNYDGIAYDGGVGVEPVERSLRYNAVTRDLSVENVPGLPMDIRGVASVGETVRYIVGGIEQGQQVSRKTLRLVRDETVGVEDITAQSTRNLDVWFNQVLSGFVVRVEGVGERRVTVEIYNVLGGLLRRTEHVLYGAGEITIEETFSDISSGVYFVRVLFGNEVVVRSVVVGGQ